MTEKGDATSLENWLDSASVCQLLNVSKKTLQNYRQRRLLSYSTIGGKVFIKKSDLEDLLERNYRLRNKKFERYDD